MDISTISSFLKLPKKVIFLFSVITAAVLFSEQVFLEKLALYDFKEEFKLWIGICFLFSTGLSILNVAEYFLQLHKENKRIKKEKADTKEKRKREEREKSESIVREKAELEAKERDYLRELERLDKFELSNIREFFIQQQNTIKMSLEDPVVIGLVKKGIIRQVGDKGYQSNITGLITFFRIDSRAIEYLESFDYETLNNTPRPLWVNGILSQNALDEKMAELGNQMLRL